LIYRAKKKITKRWLFNRFALTRWKKKRSTAPLPLFSFLFPEGEKKEECLSDPSVVTAKEHTKQRFVIYGTLFDILHIR
jgi:hypothetical protein